MIIGIVVALPDELGTLTDKKVNKGHCVFIASHVLVVCAGAGMHNAQTAAELLIAKGATHLISWGCVGGLKAGLQPGDLVLPELIVDLNHNRFGADREWYAHCYEILSASVVVHTGTLLTSTQLVAVSQEKKQLQLKTGAIAVDMESIAVARVAQQHQRPFVAIKAIIDAVNTNLPQAINYALNPQGEVELQKLLLYILRHPVEIPRLINIAFDFRQSRKTLLLVAKQLDKLATYKSLTSHS